MDGIDRLAEEDATGMIRFVEHVLFPQSFATLKKQLAHSRRLAAAWEFVEAHYHQPDLHLHTVARAAGIDYNRLNVLLRRSTGFTFHRLLTRYRILQAVARMLEHDYGLLEVAARAGFGSVRTLERHFQTIFGVPPQAFRKRIAEFHCRRGYSPIKSGIGFSA